MIGIYKILNLKNNLFYIGSTINFSKRQREHRNNLNNNMHINFHLQSSWNYHGERNFQFELIETILIKDKDYILEREQYWLDETKCYDQNIGYNVCPKAGNTLGRKCSKETKKRISEKNKGKLSGNKNPFFGKHHTEETILKMKKERAKQIFSIETRCKKSESVRGANNPNSKVSQEKAKEIREKYIPFIQTQKMLAKEYDVGQSTISRIIRNKIWIGEI